MASMEKCSEDCIYLMRGMEGEELIQQQWLFNETSNKRLWCLLVGVLGTDILRYESDVSTRLLGLGRQE